MDVLKEKFSQLQITITPKQIRDMIAIERGFRMARTNILTFNGPYLGCYPISFKTSDTNALYHLFETDPHQIQALIRQIPAINTSFNVESDPFNLLCMWLMHLAFIYIEKEKTRYEFMASVCRYFHYRVFTSTVNNSFRKGAIRSVMDAAIHGMSKKPDIVRMESWGAIIDKHVEGILDPTKKTYKILQTATPDDAFVDIAPKAQTAIRNKVVGFAVAYYDAYDKGQMIRTSSSLVETRDGERIIAQTADVVDTTMNNMVSDALSPHTWINDGYIQTVTRQFSVVSPAMMRKALQLFSETAAQQSRQRTLDKIIPAKGKEPPIYVGIRALLFEMIRGTVRFCRVKDINPGRKFQVLSELKDAYASSRSQDPDIIAIKSSVAYFFKDTDITFSEPARAALRLAMIHYILLKALHKM